MVGPLVYDLAKLHTAELLAERAKDRLAEQACGQPHAWVPKIDIRRLLPPLRTSTGSASASA